MDASTQLAQSTKLVLGTNIIPLQTGGGRGGWVWCFMSYCSLFSYNDKWGGETIYLKNILTWYTYYLYWFMNIVKSESEQNSLFNAFVSDEQSDQTN